MFFSGIILLVGLFQRSNLLLGVLYESIECIDLILLSLDIFFQPNLYLLEMLDIVIFVG
jgi:hypothetical protein